jgi:Domain of unknown function (DUF1816)
MKQRLLEILRSRVLIKIADLVSKAVDWWGQAWWVEVFTAQPQCTYFFGPFADFKEASAAVSGYVEDLKDESAQGIQTQVKRCKPTQLTIDHDLGVGAIAVSG